MQDLLILLTASFINDNELNKIMEANMRILEDTTAFRVFEARGRNEREIEIAKSMFQDGDDYTKIARNTGLSIERIEELAKEELLAHV